MRARLRGGKKWGPADANPPCPRFWQSPCLYPVRMRPRLVRQAGKGAIEGPQNDRRPHTPLALSRSQPPLSLPSPLPLIPSGFGPSASPRLALLAALSTATRRPAGRDRVVGGQGGSGTAGAAALSPVDARTTAGARAGARARRPGAHPLDVWAGPAVWPVMARQDMVSEMGAWKRRLFSEKRLARVDR